MAKAEKKINYFDVIPREARRIQSGIKSNNYQVIITL